MFDQIFENIFLQFENLLVGGGALADIAAQISCRPLLCVHNPVVSTTSSSVLIELLLHVEM